MVKVYHLGPFLQTNAASTVGSTNRLEGEAVATSDISPTSPLKTDDQVWIETAPGQSFRPLRFGADGFSELMRVDPGVVVDRHRHTGEVHVFNLQGSREMLESGEVAGQGDYVYEPAGTIDSWRATSDGPCVAHVTVVGDVEFLDDNDQVTDTVNSATERAAYLAWCQKHDREPSPQVLGEAAPS